MDPEMTEDYMFLQSVIDVTFEAIEKLQIFFQNRETVMQCALLTMSMSDYNMFNILARNAEKFKTKSGNEHLLIYRSKYMLIMMHIILK